MTVHLPEELEGGIRAEVLGGHFASEDEAVAEAVRQFLSRRQQPSASPGLGSIGAMHDDAALLDQITRDIMEGRRTRTLRLTPDE